MFFSNLDFYHRLLGAPLHKGWETTNAHLDPGSLGRERSNREIDMAEETDRKPEEKQAQPTALTRREAMLQLLRVGGVAAGAAAAGVWLSERSFRPVPAKAEQSRRDHLVAADPNLPHLVVVQNGEPRELVQRALEDLGGMKRFVGRQDVVVIKPNIAWDRTPEQAANTNPEVVAEVVRQCWQAGAKRVIVTD